LRALCSKSIKYEEVSGKKKSRKYPGSVNKYYQGAPKVYQGHIKSNALKVVSVKKEKQIR
jgi:hypothetical protein